MSTGSIAFRADETRDRRPDPIRSDHELGRNLPLPIMTIFEAHTGDATVVRADQIDELRFEDDRCAGLLRGIDKYRVNDRPAGGVEAINVVLRFDLHREDVVAVVKRRRSDDRRTSRFDCLEDAPARELDNAGAHEGVGGDRVTPVATPVDGEHTKTSPREQERGGRAGATGADNDDVKIDGWFSDGIILAGRPTVKSSQRGDMSSNIDEVWPGGMPHVGQVGERSRRVNAKDIEWFTEISGDRNPLHYDEAVAKASRFGEIVVQGGVTSAILNAVVAHDLPGPGTVFLQVNWSFKAPVRPGDTITGRAEVLEVRADKPITKLKMSVTRDDGTVALEGDAVCYTMPIARGATAGS